jgi:hypothetical protein
VSLLIQSFQRSQESASEQFAQHFHGQKIAASAGDPALTIERQATASDDAVQMRMETQLLAPGV